MNAMSMLAGTTSTDLEEGRVLQLLNMVTPEELLNDEDYQGKPPVFLTPLTILIVRRNRRGCPGGVREIRPGSRDQDSPPCHGQQAVQRRRQDIRQVRRSGFCAEGACCSCRSEVCGPNSRHDLLFRGMYFFTTHFPSSVDECVPKLQL